MCPGARSGAGWGRGGERAGAVRAPALSNGGFDWMDRPQEQTAHRDDRVVDPLRVVKSHCDELLADSDHLLQERRGQQRPPAHELRAAGRRQRGDEGEERQEHLLVVLRLQQQRVEHQDGEGTHGGALPHEARLCDEGDVQLAQQALDRPHERGKDVGAPQAEQLGVALGHRLCVQPGELRRGDAQGVGRLREQARGRRGRAGGQALRGTGTPSLLQFCVAQQEALAERFCAREHRGYLLHEGLGIPGLPRAADELAHQVGVQEWRAVRAEAVDGALGQLERE